MRTHRTTDQTAAVAYCEMIFVFLFDLVLSGNKDGGTARNQLSLVSRFGGGSGGRGPYSERSDLLKPVENVDINLAHRLNRVLRVFEHLTATDVRLISQKSVSDGLGINGDLLFRL
jgi:hypothetical protein